MMCSDCEEEPELASAVCEENSAVALVTREEPIRIGDPNLAHDHVCHRDASCIHGLRCWVYHGMPDTAKAEADPAVRIRGTWHLDGVILL